MSIRIVRILVVVVLLLTGSGCKYDRSFMHLDSNSGSPFFGLQLSVDADDAAGRRDLRRPAVHAVAGPVIGPPTGSGAASLDPPPRHVGVPLLPPSSGVATTTGGIRRPQLIPTAASSESPPKIRHSLPVSSRSDDVASTMERLWLF